MKVVGLPLKDIPSTGLDIWTDLKARSERSKVEGQLHLRLSLSTREDRDLPEDERQFETKQHCDLMTIFIDHELRKSKVSLSISRHVARVLTPSTPVVPNCCRSKGSVPYWSNPPFFIFARAPECQKLKMVG